MTTTLNQQQLKRSVMRRVYAIYATRIMFSPKGVKLMVMGLFLAEISPFSPYLSLRHIFYNMPEVTNFKALYNFHTTAFMQTQPIVQITIIAVLIVLASYFYALCRRLVTYVPYFSHGRKLAH